MDEADWLACANSTPMLEFLRGRASDLKVRLFAVACCRSLLHLMEDKRSRRAVTLGEQLADGLPCRRSDLAAVHNAAREADDREQNVGYSGWPDDPLWQDPAGWGTGQAVDYDQVERRFKHSCAARVAEHAVAQDVWPAAEAASREAERPGFFDTKEDMCRAKAAQAAYLHDLFGPLPFRPVTIDRTWLAWNDGTVPRIARHIYEGRAIDRLPILADALLDAGCDNEDLLAHCRSAGPHVRGCFAIDAILGKS